MRTSDTLMGLLAKLAFGIASAAAIGGGTALIHASATNAVQDQRLTVLEQDRAEMHELSQKLETTDRNIAVLNERLDHEVHR
jgi:cell division protein FtsB